jgi:hypothetical protein
MGKLILAILALFLIAGAPQLAEAAALFPSDVGVIHEYVRHDSGAPQNEWTVTLENLEQVTVGANQYIKLGEWGYDGPGDYSEYLIRFTDTAAYALDGSDESLVLQIGPVGTTWDFPHSLGADTGKTVKEIISIEPVTVPYGTFDNAYVLKNYFDFDDPLKDNSPFWYEYVVPQVGIVKEVDYNLRPEQLNGPYVQELVRMEQPVVTPEPLSSVLFLAGGGALVWGRRRGKCM